MLHAGGFLSEAGWFYEAEKVIDACFKLCILHEDEAHQTMAYECCTM